MLSKRLFFFFSICSYFFIKNQSISAELCKSEPNIVFILADDLGYGDLSINGQTKFATPNIDALAKGGMLFTQHYAGSTVCAPSRSTLLTGFHTGHTFIRGNREYQEEGQFPLADGVVTIAEILKSKGYVTGAFGKWGLGYPSSEGDPNHQGFDVFYGYNCQRLAHNYYPYHLWSNQTKVVLEKNSGNNKTSYAPNLIHNEALKFLEEQKDTTFFMFYPSVLPHAELVAPDDVMSLYRDRFEPEKPFKGIDNGKRYKNGGYASQDKPRAAFAAMVHLLDRQVGEIHEKLVELGIADNTIIVFSSDNGPHKEGGADPDFFNSSSHLRGYKRDLYEGGIKVPLIVHWPTTIKSGSVTNHISAFWDFVPTISEIIGHHPIRTDGISFLPTLLNQKQPKHEYLYWEFLERGGKQAVRFGDWKGIRLNMSENNNAVIELYNLRNDPKEEFNVAKDYPKVTSVIDSILKSAHTYSKEFPFSFEGH